MDTKSSIVEEAVSRLARQIAEDQAVELVGVNMFGRGRGMLLRVTIDKEGGVTLEDCARFSRGLESLLDADDIIKDGAYSLEVSSPGLNRPLNKAADFERNIGKIVRVITKEKIDNQSFFLGRITGAASGLIRLSLDDKREIEISFDNISKARLEIEIK